MGHYTTSSNGVESFFKIQKDYKERLLIDLGNCPYDSFKYKRSLGRAPIFNEPIIFIKY